MSISFPTFGKCSIIFLNSFMDLVLSHEFLCLVSDHALEFLKFDIILLKNFYFMAIWYCISLIFVFDLSSVLVYSWCFLLCFKIGFIGFFISNICLVFFQNQNLIILAEFFIQILNGLPYFSLFESSLRSLIILKCRLLNSLAV
jgi:hypothetical protein